MTFTHPVLVRWSDIDSYDHVNNVRYFDYLQEARIAFLSEVLGTTGDLFAEHPCVLVSQTVDYLRPILLRHPPYDVDVWVDSIGTTSYMLGSWIVRIMSWPRLLLRARMHGTGLARIEEHARRRRGPEI